MKRGERAGADPAEERARGGWALWLVAVALVSLAAVPAYLGQKVVEAQDRISDVLLPASSLSARLSLISARQLARFEGFALSGDVTLRRQYVGGISEEDVVYGQLRSLSAELDLTVRERLAQLSAVTTRWHLENQQVLAMEDASARQAALAASRSGYDEIQRLTNLLDSAIQGEVRSGRERMDHARALQSRIMLALALVALGATFMIGRVGAGLKRLNRESEGRRRDAVRARRDIDALLEATADGVLGIDLEGRCMSLNRAGVELLKYPEREVRERDFHDTFHHTRIDGTARPRSESRILAALRAGDPADSREVDVLHMRDGTTLPVKWAQRPLIDGRVLRGSVLTFTDMTEVKRKEAALRRAIRQREDVVSIVSHDLRNPLGVVFGATDILLELPLDAEARRRQVEIIGRAAQRMKGLIDDLLDVARIQDGALVVRRALEDVPEILEEVRQIFAHQAAEKGVALVVEVRGTHLTARLDRDRLLQALANLLDNALRLTPEGGRVWIFAEQDGAYIDINVQDTGPGIGPEALEHVFDRYWQKDEGSRGTAGLGLTIVKGVVDAHGGEVEVRSILGKGTTFTLRFPIAPVDGARERHA